MFATRLAPATIGGPRANDAAPYYHDACVPLDSLGFAQPDDAGRTRVWLGFGACGFKGETCAACGSVIAETTPADVAAAPRAERRRTLGY